jgi:hypothetical protein
VFGALDNVPDDTSPSSSSALRLDRCNTFIHTSGVLDVFIPNRPMIRLELDALRAACCCNSEEGAEQGPCLCAVRIGGRKLISSMNETARNAVGLGEFSGGTCLWTSRASAVLRKKESVIALPYMRAGSKVLTLHAICGSFIKM